MAPGQPRFVARRSASQQQFGNLKPAEEGVDMGAAIGRAARQRPIPLESWHGGVGDPCRRCGRQRQSPGRPNAAAPPPACDGEKHTTPEVATDENGGCAENVRGQVGS